MKLGVGLHPDVPEHLYHLDPVHPGPSLSSSIAKVLASEAPRHAWLKHPRLNPAFAKKAKKYDPAMAIGSAVHKLLLGAGAEIRVVEYENFTKKDAQYERDEAMARGETPLSLTGWDKAQAIAEAARPQIMDDPTMRPLLESGRSEVTGVWREGEAWCRLRVDRMPDNVLTDPFPSIMDLKTTELSVNPETWSKHAFDMGYDISAEFYKRGLRKLLPHIRHLEFVIIAIEQNEPYACKAMSFGGQAAEEAATAVALSIETWTACLKLGRWPMYEPGITSLDPPTWRSYARELRAMGMRNRLDQWQRPHDSQKKDEAA